MSSLSRVRASLSVAAVAVALGAASVGPGSVALPAAAATTTTVPFAATLPAGPVTLRHNVLAGISLVTGLPADPAAVMTVAVGLQRPDAPGEARLERALNDPSSSEYRRFLSPDEFATRFGVEPARFASATAWLQSTGGSIVHASSSRDIITLSATVLQVERLFGVTIQSYNNHGTTFLANTAAPTVPGPLGITTVVGLNTFQQFTRANQRSGVASKPAQSICRGGVCVGTATPADLQSVYDLPPAFTGQGQSVAVFGEGKTANVINDLTLFEKHFGFPSHPVRVVCTIKNDCGADSSGDGEWDIDMQAETGMAPGIAGQTLYFAQSLLDAQVATSFSTWVSDPSGPLQADASFGECESDPANPVFTGPLFIIDVDNNPNATFGEQLGNNLEAMAGPILSQAALQGKSLFASTGDTGGSCAALVAPMIGAGNGVLNQAVPLIGYPAGDPHAVGVGGTVLYTDGGTPAKRVLEYAWTHGGGGQSVFITQPAYQNGVSNILGKCLTDPTGMPTNTGQPCRGLPDVSAQSGDLINGYSVYSSGTLGTGAGTSLSSPLWTGIWARIQSSASAPKGYGFANESIYKLGKLDQAKYFFDVTVGSNVEYAATPGWDYTTGWGSPDVAHFIAALQAAKTVPTTATPSTSPAPTTSPSALLTAGQTSPNTSGAGTGVGAAAGATLLLGLGAIVGSGRRAARRRGR